VLFRSLERIKVDSSPSCVVEDVLSTLTNSSFRIVPDIPMKLNGESALVASVPIFEWRGYTAFRRVVTNGDKRGYKNRNHGIMCVSHQKSFRTELECFTV